MSRITDVMVNIDTEAILARYGKNNSMAAPRSSISGTST